jgi:hypothetical protein
MNKTILVVLLVASFFGKAAAQKGNKSLAAGVIIALPQAADYYQFQTWNNGVGAEAIGQYNFSNKSALLLQLQVIHFSGQTNYGFSDTPVDYTSISLKGGYRYDFTRSGFYANFLLGVEFYDMYTPATLGIGKRFQIKNHFLDAGIEATGGYVPHYSIRAVYSLAEKTNED